MEPQLNLKFHLQYVCIVVAGTQGIINEKLWYLSWFNVNTGTLLKEKKTNVFNDEALAFIALEYRV